MDQTHSQCNLQYPAHSIQWWQNEFTTAPAAPWLSSPWCLLHYPPSHLTLGLSQGLRGPVQAYILWKAGGWVPFCTVLITIKETLISWTEPSTCHFVRCLGQVLWKKLTFWVFSPTIFLWTTGNLFCAGPSLLMVMLQCYQHCLGAPTWAPWTSYRHLPFPNQDRTGPSGSDRGCKLPFSNNHQETLKKK